MGAIIAPPVPDLHTPSPRTSTTRSSTTVGRVLDLFDIDIGIVRRWGEDDALKRGSPSLRKIVP